MFAGMNGQKICVGNIRSLDGDLLRNTHHFNVHLTLTRILVCVRVRLKLLYLHGTRKSNIKTCSYIVTSPWNDHIQFQLTRC